MFTRYKAWVENQGFRIKRFRCDNGRGEYNNAEFLRFLHLAGITWEPAPPYTQHKNGVSERMIQTINSKARCMLLDAELGVRFWAEAVKTAVYLHRRTPTSSLPGNQSPFEMLYGSQPPLHHLRRFGCTVYRHIPKEQREGKFADRARPCMMLGYVHQTTKIWRVWDFSGRGRAVDSSNVVFVEHENAIQNQTSGADLETADLEFPPELEPNPSSVGTGALQFPIEDAGMRVGNTPPKTGEPVGSDSPKGSDRPQGMDRSVQSTAEPASHNSMYLPTLGEENWGHARCNPALKDALRRELGTSNGRLLTLIGYLYVLTSWV